jgi:hypothetical protein
LITKESALSSKAIDDKLAKIRKDLTRSVGKKQRVLLKSVRPVFDKRIKALKEELNKHQETLKSKLQKELDDSRDRVVGYYLPLVKASPPDGLLGSVMTEKPSENDCRDWLIQELDRAFPKAEALLKKMELEVRFKDVTYETLNAEGFMASLEAAYPQIDWHKPFDEFTAMGEATSDDTKTGEQVDGDRRQ